LLSAAARATFNDIVSKIDISTKIVPLESFYEEITGKVPLDFIDQVWLSDIVHRVSRRRYLNVKRIFDIIFSLIGLAITASIFPFIVLAIKLDSPGPIFYIQKRTGKDKKNFNLYKFRTMLALNEQYSIFRANIPNQITRIGRIIKQLHIDEFPQFFNILKGDISFVGPRPEWEKLSSAYEQEIPFINTVI